MKTDKLKNRKQLRSSVWKETRFRWDPESVLSLNSHQFSQLCTLLEGFTRMRGRTHTHTGSISQSAACCELRAESTWPNKAQLVYQRCVCSGGKKKNKSVCVVASACRVTEGLRWLTGTDVAHRQGKESPHHLFQLSSRLALQISRNASGRQIRTPGTLASPRFPPQTWRWTRLLQQKILIHWQFEASSQSACVMPKFHCAWIKHKKRL